MLKAKRNITIPQQRSNVQIRMKRLYNNDLNTRLGLHE